MALAPTHTPPAIPSSIYALIADLIQATHPVTARALACLLPRRAKQKTGLCFLSVWASFNRFRLGTYNTTTTTPIHTRQQRTLEIRFPMRTKSKSRNQHTTTQLPNTLISFIFIFIFHISCLTVNSKFVAVRHPALLLSTLTSLVLLLLFIPFLLRRCMYTRLRPRHHPPLLKAQRRRGQFPCVGAFLPWGLGDNDLQGVDASG